MMELNTEYSYFLSLTKGAQKQGMRGAGAIKVMPSS